jgi:hypothetical protein
VAIAADRKMNAKRRERGRNRRKKRKRHGGQNLHEVHNCVTVMDLAQRAAAAAVEQQPLTHLRISHSPPRETKRWY